MAEVVLFGRVRVPAGAMNHSTFRRWIRRVKVPGTGQISFIQGQLWVEETEDHFHNQMVLALTLGLGRLNLSQSLGRIWFQTMLLTNRKVKLSTEPDAMFASWDTLRARRVKLVGGDRNGGVEVVGTPDMVLEVVSRSSIQKDKGMLPSLYWQAGIPEYWLVDPRRSPVRFDILRATTTGYRRVRAVDGWRKSRVFDVEFRIVESTDPLGDPAYRLESR